MFKTIEKHKIFILLLLALITLAVGFVFTDNSRTKNSDADTDVWNFYIAIEDRDIIDDNGIYTNSDKRTFNVGKLTYTLSIKFTANKSGQFDHDDAVIPESLKDTPLTVTKTTPDTSLTYKQIEIYNAAFLVNANYSLNLSASYSGATGLSKFAGICSVSISGNYITLSPSISTLDYTYTDRVGGVNGADSNTYNIGYMVQLLGAYSYTPTFYANGGAFSDGNSEKKQSVTWYETYGDLEEPTRTGYTFNGWATNANGNGGDVAASNETTSGPFADVWGTSNEQIYATWVENVTVSFDGNQGSGSTTPTGVPSAVENSIYSYYRTVTPPTRPGYTFNGFYTASSGGTQTHYASGSGKTTPNSAGKTLDHTLYAQWTPLEYTITFDQNGGSGGTASRKATFDSTYPSITKPTRTGYTFLGYYTGRNGSGTQIYNSSGTSTATYTTATDTELYAHWQTNTYNILFEVSEGNLLQDPAMELNSWGSGSWSTDYAHSGNHSYKIVGTTAAREAYLYTKQTVPLNNSHIYYICIWGYQTAKLGSVDCYWPEAEPLMNGSHGKSISVGEANKWNLYSWRCGRSSFSNGSYKVRFDFNNGNNNGTMYFDSARIIDLTATYGAGAEPDQAWCDANLSYLQSINQTYDSPVSTLPDSYKPSKSGYTFTGYFDAVSGGTKYFDVNGTWANPGGNTIWTFTNDITLYAQWEANTYNVIIDYGNAVNLLTDPSFEKSNWGGTKVSTYSHSGAYSRKIVGYSGQAETLMNSSAKVHMEQNHIYYISIYGYQNTLTSGSSIECFWPVIGGYSAGSVGIKSAGQWNLYSWRVQRSYGTGDYTFRFDFNNNGTAGEVYFDSAKVIDLTATYGAGNEPSTDWCDLHLSGMQAVSVDYDSPLPTISVPEKMGYTFEGAYNAINDGTKYLNANGTSAKVWDIDSDTTLYCRWEENWINRAIAPSGAGIPSNPYKISTAENLGWLAKFVNHENTSPDSYYIYCEQTANINLADCIWFPIGTESKPFKGSYDGKGYSISNLNTTTITYDGTRNIYSYVGLFGNVTKKSDAEKGLIKNVILLSGKVSGYYYVGSIAGYISNSTIQDCYSYADSHCHKHGGGFVGYAVSSHIENSYFKGSINTTGNEKVGGFIGYFNGATLKSCAYEGKGTQTSFIGYASTGTGASGQSIEDCLVITTTNFALIGNGNSYLTIKNCLSQGGNKYYYGNTNNFSNWVISTTNTPLPVGLAWVATGGVRVTSINQITALGYTAG